MTRMAKGSEQAKENEVAPPSFERVAQLVTGRDPPNWLIERFRKQSASLALDRHTSKTGSTKAEVVRHLQRIRDAAGEICNALSDEMTRAFLVFPSHSDEIRNLEANLAHLSHRAETARSSPPLSTESGKTRPGPGLATAPGILSPLILCAMMIAEAWKFVRGKYPSARNREAAEAAEMLWELCVLPDGDRLPRTERVRFGNPLNAWRPHFKAAMDTQLGFENDRSALRRYLSLSAHFEKSADLEPIPEEKGAN
jgi:hypothetical protein